jgi:tetratricopeptide (TPR) repeat protein
MLAAAVCACALGQSQEQNPATPPSGTSASRSPASASSSSASSSSAGHKSTHHIQVPDEDSPSQPAELLQAEAAIEKQRYAEADSFLHKLLDRDATNYVAWFDLGFTENALGNIDASIAAYRKSVAAKPDVFESNLNLGLQLAKTSQPDAAKYLRAATELKPTSHAEEGRSRAWLALGHELENSNPDESLEAYRKAAELQPNEAEPHLAAGLLLERENKFGDAADEYRRAQALDSESSEAITGLANIYMRAHRFPEAEEYLRKLLAERPNSAPVEIQLGRVLAAEGRNDDAIAAMQAGIKLAPTDEAAQRDIAEVYSNAGKHDLAESTYRLLVEAHPNDAELHRRLGQELLRQKKTKEAQQEFLLTVKLKPDWGDAYGDVAFAASQNQDFALALRGLDARAKLLPENPVTYFLRASASDHLHDFKTAAANYRLFLNTAQGKYPDYEWKAKHRLIAIEPKK